MRGARVEERKCRKNVQAQNERRMVSCLRCGWFRSELLHFLECGVGNVWELGQS